MSDYLIFQTDHWVVSHRRDSRYSGYLIVSSISNSLDFNDLPEAALQEFGSVMKKTEALLLAAFSSEKVIFFKLGFSPGFNFHFHAAHVGSVLIKEIESQNTHLTAVDGNDTILYLSRHYCERELSEDERSTMNAGIQRLKSFVTNRLKES